MYSFADPIHLGFLPAKQTIAVIGRKENNWKQNSISNILDLGKPTSESKDEFVTVEKIALNHVDEKFETEVEVKLETNEPVPTETKVQYKHVMPFVLNQVSIVLHEVITCSLDLEYR